MLLLTNKPRFFYVDAATLECKEVGLTAQAVASKGDNVLVLKRKKKTVKVQCVLYTATSWEAAVCELSAAACNTRPGIKSGITAKGRRMSAGI